jgi:arginine exporter protein ArgO
MTEPSAAFVAGLLAGYGVAIPVGAIAILIMGLAARTSFRVGAAAALGVATADGLYAVLAVAGGAALAGVVEPAAGPLRRIAAVVLLGLAAWTIVGAWRRHRGPAGPARSATGLDRPGRAFAGLTALTLLNPMTIVYFAALVIGRQSAGGPGPAGAALFAVGAFLASASWQLLIAGGGRLVGRLLAGPRGRLGTALASSALIAILALHLLLG